jgi:CDP-diacylglycerol--glycerol-3-phosphate 3-phosphatidyltransferase
MQTLPDWLKNGFLRLMEPIAAMMVRRGVHPNTITIAGTLFSVAGGVIYGTGHITTGGLLLGITALTDVLDGMVARKSGTSSVFGAFLDSTLDRLADGAVLGGLAVFYAINPLHNSMPMVVVCLAGIIGAFLTSYIRARAESLGLDAKVGMLQRPERVILLSAPQAFFGLALDGWVLAIIINILTITAWITVVQRVAYVHGRTRSLSPDLESDEEPANNKRRDRQSTSRRDTTARPAMKGE